MDLRGYQEKQKDRADRKKYESYTNRIRIVYIANYWTLEKTPLEVSKS